MLKPSATYYNTWKYIEYQPLTTFTGHDIGAILKPSAIYYNIWKYLEYQPWTTFTGQDICAMLKPSATYYNIWKYIEYQPWTTFTRAGHRCYVKAFCHILQYLKEHRVSELSWTTFTGHDIGAMLKPSATYDNTWKCIEYSTMDHIH